MPDHQQNSDRTAATSNGARRFILFVVGDEPNSRLARQNFAALQQTINIPVECEIIDVLEDFQTALQHDILATPALVQIEPVPQLTVLGNLSDTDRVLTALGLKAPGK